MVDAAVEAGGDEAQARADFAALSVLLAAVVVVTNNPRYAHLIGDRFPDGHLFVNLRGYDPAGPLEPARALAGLLYGLGVAPEEIPVEVEAALQVQLGEHREVAGGQAVAVPAGLERAAAAEDLDQG